MQSPNHGGVREPYAGQDDCGNDIQNAEPDKIPRGGVNAQCRTNNRSRRKNTDRPKPRTPVSVPGPLDERRGYSDEDQRLEGYQPSLPRPGRVTARREGGKMIRRDEHPSNGQQNSR